MRKTAWAICCALFVAATSAPQKAPDFSGTFALASLKGGHVAKTLRKILLKVVQDGDSLEIVESFS